MDRLGLLAQVLPELMPAHGVDQPGGAHYYDVFDHSVECLAVLDALVSSEAEDDGTGVLAMRETFEEALGWYPVREYLDGKVQSLPRYVLLKLAGLLHDVSKPETKSTDESGRTRFLRHPELGAAKTEVIGRRLRFGNDETRFMAVLVEEHLRPTMLQAPGEPPSRRALYRFFRDLGDAAPACLFLLLADGASAAGPRLTRGSWRKRLAYVSYLLERGEDISGGEDGRPRLITGHDIMQELRVSQGPELGWLMRELEDAIGAGEVASRDEAIEYARALIAGAGSNQDG
jgi:poly(A) polymerase